MTMQMKVAIDLDIDGLIVVAVNERGGRSAPTIVDKDRLIAKLAEHIHKIVWGIEYMGPRRDAIHVCLPVELHMVIAHTIGSETMAMSVLEVIAQAVNVKPSQIVAEYPPPDRAVAAIQHAEAMVAEHMRRVDHWQGKYAEARLGGKAVEAHMESTAEEMRKVIEEFGLEDTPLDEGYHTIDTRLAVLEEELRRMRTVIAAGAR